MIHRFWPPLGIDVYILCQTRALRSSLASPFAQHEDLANRRGFVIEQVMIRNVQLPARVKDAIEEKLSAEQQALRMRFVLEKERQEAERKRIEAQGISDFQKIVSAGISDQLLAWKGIEATQQTRARDKFEGGDHWQPQKRNAPDHSDRSALGVGGGRMA
jgi:SPFH domain / Band 7 family